MNHGAGRACITCGGLIVFLNHVLGGDPPADHQRCHQRKHKPGPCDRERSIPSGWKEKGWPDGR